MKTFLRVLPAPRLGYFEVCYFYKIGLKKIQENVSILYGFTGAINDRFLTNQGATASQLFHNFKLFTHVDHGKWILRDHLIMGADDGVYRS